jgi:hypothetical protein
MQSNTIPSVEDIPFDVSPSTRALLSEILGRLAALEEENRLREEENHLLKARLEELEDVTARERASTP